MIHNSRSIKFSIKICISTLFWVAAALVLQTTQVQAIDNGAVNFFCGVDPAANSGFVVASDNHCADGTFAAQADNAGLISCQFRTRCVPLVADVKAAILRAAPAGKTYESLSETEIYAAILASHYVDGANLPFGDISCRVKGNPCAPRCPSANECANPKAGGAVKVLRLLPTDGRGLEGAITSPGGVVAHPGHPTGTAQ